MKPALLLVGVACFLLNVTNYAGDNTINTKVVELQAVEVSEILAKVLQQYEYLEAYTFVDDRIIAPYAKMTMVYNVDSKQVMIAANLNEATIELLNTNYEVQDLGNGIKAVCYCMADSDDCEFQPSSEHGPGRNDYKCDGTCSCGVAITIRVKPDVLQMQTPDGNWTSPDKF